MSCASTVQQEYAASKLKQLIRFLCHARQLYNRSQLLQVRESIVYTKAKTGGELTLLQERESIVYMQSWG